MNLLFLEKVFLKKKKQDLPLRGVELFNLFLVRDLVREGVRVVLPAERSWQTDMESVWGDGRPDFCWVPNTGLDFLNLLLAGLRSARSRFDVLLLGNVGHSLVPVIRLLRARNRFSRYALIAHREASARFVKALRSLPGDVIAVNEQIARPFRQAGYPQVTVEYGIMNAGLFHPPASSKPDSATVEFAVMGMLDNAWKGSDTAVNAFRALPADIRSRCRLHLASFTQPPAFPETDIVAYPWMPVERIPGFLREMDVLLVPSRDEEVMRETFSQAVVQGMLTGLPVVVSNRPILTEKVDQGGGCIAHTEADWTEAMRRLAADPALRRELGRQGRRTALNRYVWDSRRFMRRHLAAPEERAG